MWWLCLFFVISYVSCQEEKCCTGVNECFNTRPPFNHLPVPGCLSEINPNYNLYTRSNRNNRAMVTNTTIPPAFRGNRKTVFIIHGFTNSRDSEWLTTMKNKFLDNYDYNVIIVGWADGAQTVDYPWAASNTRVVGARTAQIARNLIRGGAHANNIWCVGHSLGAHSCGHFGKRLPGLRRITGLDPAGPWFDEYDINCGLTPRDAAFVDVIHTGGKDHSIIDYGTMRALGDVDFYPNDGGSQPGCNFMEEQKPDIPEPELFPCDHGICRDYFMESLDTSCRFNARERCTDWRNIPGSCSPCPGGAACQTMGFPAQSVGARGLYRLTTNGSKPYCRG